MKPVKRIGNFEFYRQPGWWGIDAFNCCGCVLIGLGSYGITWLRRDCVTSLTNIAEEETE